MADIRFFGIQARAVAVVCAVLMAQWIFLHTASCGNDALAPASLLPQAGQTQPAETQEEELSRLEIAVLGEMDGKSLIRWYTRLAVLRHQLGSEAKLAILQDLSARITQAADRKEISEDLLQGNFFYFRQPEWKAPVLIPWFPSFDTWKEGFQWYPGEDPSQCLLQWVEEKKKSRDLLLVGVNGGPGAGKTECAKALESQLKAKGLRVLRIEIDDYMKPRSKRYATGAFGLEKYDIDRLKRDLEALDKRQSFRLPRLVFPDAEIVEEGDWVHPQELDVILFDGEFTFAMDELRDRMHAKLYVDEIDPVRFFQVGEKNLRSRGYASWEDVAWRFATAQQPEFDALTRKEIGNADVLFRPHQKKLWFNREDVTEKVRDVLAHFPVGDVYQIKRVRQGAGPGRPMKIVSSNGKFLLKKMNPYFEDLLGAARDEVLALLPVIEQQGPIVPIIPNNLANVAQEEDRYFVPAADGDIYFLYPWIDGDEIPQGGEYRYPLVTPGQAHNLTVAIAQTHKIWQTVVLKGKRGPRPLRDLQPLLGKLKALKARLLEKKAQDAGYAYTRGETFFLENADFLIEQTVSCMANLPKDVYESLPKGIIHGDTHPGNAIFWGDKCWVYDWDHLRFDVRALDFFCGLFQELTPAGKYNIAELKRVIRDYQQFVPLTDRELAVLPELARLNSLYNVLHVVRPEDMYERSRYPEQLKKVDPLEQAIWLMDHHPGPALMRFFKYNLAKLKAVAAAKQAGDFDKLLKPPVTQKEGDVSVSSYSVQGPRPTFEDRYLDTRIDIQGIVHGHGRFLAVADGHRGTATVEKLVQHLPHVFRESLQACSGNCATALEDAFSKLAQITTGEKSGSTLSVVYIPDDENTVYVSIVGDSPVIVRDKDGKVQWSPEHNFATEPAAAAHAVEKGAFFDGQWVYLDASLDRNFGLPMSRAFGDKLFAHVIRTDPDIYSLPIGPGSAVLLATDGLSLSPRMQAEGIAALMNMAGIPDAAQAIIAKALALYDRRDNATAIVWAWKVPETPLDIANEANQELSHSL